MATKSAYTYQSSVLTSRLWLVLVLSTLSLLASTEDYQQLMKSEDVVERACIKLQQFFPGQVFFPDDTLYKHAQSRYWSTQQGELQPPCRLLPKNAQDVHTAVLSLGAQNISFAFASGGHSSVTSASNIADGVAIDLSSLSDIELVDDNNAAWLGVGAHWADVYAALEPSGLVVSGGRVADVGVGGYVLGGGFSWFANQYGWTCDSAIEFEVITPDAQHLHVNVDDHKDLFWALKGSLGAFGVVIRIKVPTIRNRAVYGGAISYSQEHMPVLFDALVGLSKRAKDDLHTQGYVSFGWSEKVRAMGTSAYLVNTRSGEPSAAFHTFQQIPHIGSSLREMSLRESAEEIGKSNLYGFRRSKFTLTTNCDAHTMQLMHRLCRQANDATQFGEEDMMGVTFQPLTVPHLQAQSNIFNAPAEGSPLLLVSVEVWWSDASQDHYFEQRTQDLHSVLTAALRRANALRAFVYPNYAARWQNPFEGIGVERTQKLVAIKQRYDAKDIWRRLVPGIWHV
ncbi:hypothetical protein LTR36_002539 [Oleoguttula mirabilis]|uniref:FAD-binding PCMH-type domain-containing protein n=1 Tax=Oleoguttula mirabilis TaxID=1507867 RepID=A0AAV9JL25_9PEZI|nr:hypothetical protein LTR36_002539 [Oleoguttula mirabilis]